MPEAKKERAGWKYEDGKAWCIHSPRHGGFDPLAYIADPASGRFYQPAGQDGHAMRRAHFGGRAVLSATARRFPD
jgi:hypothetical protein